MGKVGRVFLSILYVLTEIWKCPVHMFGVPDQEPLDLVEVAETEPRKHLSIVLPFCLVHGCLRPTWVRPSHHLESERWTLREGIGHSLPRMLGVRRFLLSRNPIAGRIRRTEGGSAGLDSGRGPRSRPTAGEDLEGFVKLWQSGLSIQSVRVPDWIPDHTVTKRGRQIEITHRLQSQEQREGSHFRVLYNVGGTWI